MKKQSPAASGQPLTPPFRAWAQLGRGVRNRTSLAQKVGQALRKAILDGRLAGDRALPSEGEFAQIFGVSRTVVREAIRTLQAQGLVEVTHGRRPRVRPVDGQLVVQSLDALVQRSEGSLFHLAEVRTPLETEIAALAAERASPEQINRMEATIQELVDAPSLDELIEADMRFHYCLAEATGNPLFRLLLEAVSGLLHESHRHTSIVSIVDVAAEGHRRVLEAVRKRDPAAARVAMLDHLETARQELETEAASRKKPGPPRSSAT